MPSSPDFIAHALDLLAPLGPVTARPMFGGHGVYLRGLMFGIVDDDELFLKADDQARPTFEAAGCRQFTYPSAKGPMAMGYFRPPDDAHEDAEAMAPWARLAVDAAERKATAKAMKARPPGLGRGARRAGSKATAEKAGGRAKKQPARKATHGRR
jgi:DNA transformation protein